MRVIAGCVSVSLLACAACAPPPVAGPDLAREEQAAPAADASRLTVDSLFGSREFATDYPPLLAWSRVSPSYYALAPAVLLERGASLVRVDIETGKATRIASAAELTPAGALQPLYVEGLQLSADENRLLIFTNTRRVWRHNTRGDYWLLDLAARRLTRLGGDAEPASMLFAKLAPDASRVAYVRANNLYVQDLATLEVVPLTRDGSEDLINGTSDWVNEEELLLRDAFRWSPDSRSIAFWQFDTSGVERFCLVDYTAGLYPRITSFPYPKVGGRNSATRAGVVGAAGGPVRWLDVPGDPREHYLPGMEWTPDGRELLLQQMNRLQNTNRVMRADPQTGQTRIVLTETDAAWLENENPVRWVDGGQRFVWLSEREGWRHAYLADARGEGLDAITRGPFDVIEIEGIDDTNRWLYFAASPDQPTQRYLYRVGLPGGEPRRLSPAGQPGWHTYDVSPDARWAVHAYSTFTTPPVVELVRMEDHAVVRTLASNDPLRARVNALRKPRSEFFRVTVADGVTLDGWRLQPPDPGPRPPHPLLFHVYGEPHGQTVQDRWPGQTGLWHWMLAQEGYEVASVDNRGTMAPRGRAWRKCVHRRIGQIAPEEQAAAARQLLARWPSVDPRRVGIWGWSGGGSTTLHAILRFPDLYATAISVAPNPQQLLYDTIYQERYMGLPDSNALGYRLGSPITYASRLQGNLLLVHGTGDDNDHYQGTEWLMNELIAYNKVFYALPYPSRTHAIREGRNTQRHLYTQMTDYLHRHLLREPAAAPTPRE